MATPNNAYRAPLFQGLMLKLILALALCDQGGANSYKECVIPLQDSEE